MDNKKKLLNEEVNKFRLLSEYAFYEDRAGEDPNAIDSLVLGNEMSEEEEEFGKEEPSEEEGGELDIPDEDIDIPGEEELDDSSDEEGGGDDDFDFGGDEPSEEPEMAPEEPAEEEIELDVTELVAGSEEAKAAADAANVSAASANKKIDQLMGMMSKLEKQSDSMNQISSKIDSLEGELEKRAPTPNEKLEMISLDSAPFNLRLGDFWKDQEGQYDVMSDKKPEEYVLDKKAIETDYSDTNIKDTFNDDNEYEEEDF